MFCLEWGDIYLSYEMYKVYLFGQMKNIVVLLAFQVCLNGNKVFSIFISLLIKPMQVLYRLSECN